MIWGILNFTQWQYQCEQKGLFYVFDADQKAIFRPLPKKMRTDLAIHVHLDTLHKVSFFEVSNELDTEYSNQRVWFISCSADLHKRSKFNQKESRWSQTVTCTATELYLMKNLGEDYTDTTTDHYRITGYLFDCIYLSTCMTVLLIFLLINAELWQNTS